MSRVTYTTITGFIFAVIAALHILRLVFRWDAQIGGWHAPVWFSIVAGVLALYLAIQGFLLRKK